MNMEKGTFTVSEFAEYTGVSVRTLHYYDSKNILKPKRDNQSGHRIYDKEDLIQLHKIMTLKFLGLTLDNISEYMQQNTFGLSFIDTLHLQETKLRKDREQIDTALESIHRTIQLFEDEKEVNDAILVSLLSGMQNERKQQELTEGIIRSDIIEAMFPGEIEDKMTFEKEMMQFYKKAKQLYGRSADDFEVKEMLDAFYRGVLKAFKIDTLEELAEIYTVDFDSQEDTERINQYLYEMDRMFPTPLSEKEDKWLQKITEEYSDSLSNKKSEEN